MYLPNGSAHTIKYSLKNSYLYTCGFEKEILVWRIDSINLLLIQ
jgi:hypothetical protein